VSDVVEIMGCVCSRQHCTYRPRQSFAAGGGRLFDCVSARMWGSCLLNQFDWAKLHGPRCSATVECQAVFVVCRLLFVVCRLLFVV